MPVHGAGVVAPGCRPSPGRRCRGPTFAAGEESAILLRQWCGHAGGEAHLLLIPEHEVPHITSEGGLPEQHRGPGLREAGDLVFEIADHGALRIDQLVVGGEGELPVADLRPSGESAMHDAAAIAPEIHTVDVAKGQP